MENTILAALATRGYRAFIRPFELNIVGVRADSTKPNAFDDSIHVFYRNREGQLVQHQFSATTDPGTYWLLNPLNPQGTAILKQGQYIATYMIGLHRGKYKALVQKRPVTVLRDYDRKAVLDFLNGKEDTGLFGINIHRAAETGTTQAVDKYSAGCQVFQKASDFDLFMQLCERHRQLYGNEFTYTLIDERALAREARKNG
ncbi:hypothetical protein [Flaviaesturariibacter aridisoli]|uniref:Uncharacterized protein n=1 Tax=Flaviaesturariibacter aridisoli TaxID=2545761 RepID=A0A4R4DY26_9BACT|nr:hypothetical protein [Flaviaesturariibacter aridisoli]TCZ68349.1 hypothetical protein E0486_14250 [Flaviaesturariibacter aridisoli]